MSENFKNFELRFHDYCIQADYRNLAKNPETERGDYYKKPLQEISKDSKSSELILQKNPTHTTHASQKTQNFAYVKGLKKVNTFPS